MKNVLYLDMILYDEYIESTKHVNDPISIKEGDRLSTVDLNLWDDFVDTILNTIHYYDFDITDEHQSGKSYSYYISFYPISEDGVRFEEEVKVIFRLSDHRLKREMNTKYNRIKKAVFKSFEVNSESYETPYDVMEAVVKICDGLQQGDYQVLYKH